MRRYGIGLRHLEAIKAIPLNESFHSSDVGLKKSQIRYLREWGLVEIVKKKQWDNGNTWRATDDLRILREQMKCE